MKRTTPQIINKAPVEIRNNINVKDRNIASPPSALKQKFVMSWRKAAIGATGGLAIAPSFRNTPRDPLNDRASE